MLSKKNVVISQHYNHYDRKDMEQNTAKRVPYGIQDFVQVIEQNCYYVDKTMYIPKLEDEPNNLFFIRPRRFGKSVFLRTRSA